MDYPTTGVEQQSLQGEIAELRSVVNEIKNRVFEGNGQLQGGGAIPASPMASHKLINIKNLITEIKTECVEILKAVSLL